MSMNNLASGSIVAGVTISLLNLKALSSFWVKLTELIMRLFLPVFLISITSVFSCSGATSPNSTVVSLARMFWGAPAFTSFPVKLI